MGLLDGDIAKIAASALVGAGMTKPVVLIKTTAGTRTPGAISSGTHPTTTSHPAKGLPVDTRVLMRDGTLIAGVDRVIRILGATLPAGITPAPGDAITLEGTTSRIVAEGVSRDPASATYLCQCRS